MSDGAVPTRASVAKRRGGCEAATMRNDASPFRRAPLLALLAVAASCGVPRTAPAPLAAALPLPVITPAPAGALRVLVYNIHAGKDAARTPRIAELADLVRHSSADVVLLQEVDQLTRRSGNVDQPAELASRSGYHAAFGRTIDYDGGRFGIRPPRAARRAAGRRRGATGSRHRDEHPPRRLRRQRVARAGGRLARPHRRRGAR